MVDLILLYSMRNDRRIVRIHMVGTTEGVSHYSNLSYDSIVSFSWIVVDF